MSIVAVNEIGTGGIQEDDEGVRTLTRTYQVQTSNPYDGQVAVLSATGVPRRGDFYNTTTESDINLTVRTVRAERQSDSRLHWTVTAEYSDKNEGDDEQKNPNPLERPAIITRSFASYQKVPRKVTQLTQGSSDFGSEVPETNSAGMPYENPTLVDEDDYVVVITKNYPTFDDNFWRPYHNSINSNQFLGADEHTLKLKIASVPPRQVETVPDIGPVTYYEVTVELHYRKATWLIERLDEGFYELADAAQNDPSLRFKPILDKNQQPFTTPQPLDGEGAALDHGDEPVYRKFRVGEEKDFSQLGLI